MTRPAGVWPGVERNRTLWIEHGQIGNRTPIAEMRLISSNPIEKGPSDLPPAVVLGRAAQPMKPWHHPAGSGLGKPKSQLRRCLRHVSPVWLCIAISPRNIRDSAALHDGPGNTALLRTVPYRGFARAALMVGIEPRRHLAYLLQVLHGIEPTTEIPHVH